MRLILLTLPDEGTMRARLLEASKDPFYQKCLYPRFLSEAGEKKFPDGVVRMIQSVAGECEITLTDEEMASFIRALIPDQDTAEETLLLHQPAPEITLPGKEEMLRRLRGCMEHNEVYGPVFYHAITAAASTQVNPRQLVVLVFSAMQRFTIGMPKEIADSEIELVPTFIRALTSENDAFFRSTQVHFEQMQKEVCGVAA